MLILTYGQSRVFFAMAPTEDAIAKLADLNIKRAILPLPPAGADTVLPILDTYAKHIK